MTAGDITGLFGGGGLIEKHVVLLLTSRLTGCFDGLREWAASSHVCVCAQHAGIKSGRINGVNMCVRVFRGRLEWNCEMSARGSDSHKCNNMIPAQPNMFSIKSINISMQTFALYRSTLGNLESPTARLSGEVQYRPLCLPRGKCLVSREENVMPPHRTHLHLTRGWK